MAGCCPAARSAPSFSHCCACSVAGTQSPTLPDPPVASHFRPSRKPPSSSRVNAQFAADDSFGPVDCVRCWFACSVHCKWAPSRAGGTLPWSRCRRFRVAGCSHPSGVVHRCSGCSHISPARCAPVACRDPRPSPARLAQPHTRPHAPEVLRDQHPRLYSPAVAPIVRRPSRRRQLRQLRRPTVGLDRAGRHHRRAARRRPAARASHGARDHDQGGVDRVCSLDLDRPAVRRGDARVAGRPGGRRVLRRLPDREEPVGRQRLRLGGDLLVLPRAPRVPVPSAVLGHLRCAGAARRLHLRRGRR